MIPSYPRRDALRRTCGGNRPLQHRQKLLDSGFLLFHRFSLAVEYTRIKLCGEQRILEAFHHPIEDRYDHLDVHVRAQFAALQSEAHKGERAVRIFADEETVNLALQHEIGTVISKQRNTVRNPVVVQQVFGAHQPVSQHLEKAGLTDYRRRLKALGEGADRALVHLEEQPILAAKVLENGAFGNAERDGDVTDAGRVITLLGQMFRGNLDDAAALRVRTWTRGIPALVKGRSSAIAGDSRHRE